jgi:hypothetical protein
MAQIIRTKYRKERACSWKNRRLNLSEAQTAKTKALSSCSFAGREAMLYFEIVHN